MSKQDGRLEQLLQNFPYFTFSIMENMLATFLHKITRPTTKTDGSLYIIHCRQPELNAFVCLLSNIQAASSVVDKTISNVIFYKLTLFHVTINIKLQCGAYV